MAKFFLNEKWKKRSIAALSMALSLTFALGVATACGPSTTEDDDDDDTSTTEVDTQLLKNGNFEFYSEKETALEDKREFINSPTSWSFNYTSPTSDTRSGIINTEHEEWDELTKSTFSLVDFDPDQTGSEYKTQANAKKATEYAMENWDKASTYDRLEFLYKYDNYFTGYKISTYDRTTEEGVFFADYKYTIDFEDVEKLREELGDEDGYVQTHYAEDDEEAENNTHVLMIHNSVDKDGVLGTAQNYKSSTTITLQAGTAAQVSVWVKTANLKHYYSASPVEVTKDAGAYIGVINKVGGTDLGDMQIKNIISDEWQQYTIYVRANTFASTTTFQIVLGLGMGDTNNRFEEVDGYALFDDLTCEIIDSAKYEEIVTELGGSDCDLGSKKEEKIFDAANGLEKTAFSLDLHANFESLPVSIENVNIALTEEKTDTGYIYTSKFDDTRDNGNDTDNIGTVMSLDDIRNSNNLYLKTIAENDFKNFPSHFNEDEIIMLLSTNKAAYTATMTQNDDEFTLESNHYMLVSFFVKTSSIRSGKTGATAVLVDDANTPTTISAFDSTTVATVDIDDEHTDIYDGWVQCFFFVKNETKTTHSFKLKLSYGPTSVISAAETNYDDGYAAFANFETMELDKTQYGYASSNNRAQTVSLTGGKNFTSKFDDNSAATPFSNGGLAVPVNFQGVQSGTERVFGTYKPRTPAELEAAGLYTGLLNSDPEYVAKYIQGEAPWNDRLNDLAGIQYNEANEEDWWNAIFADPNHPADFVTQPLVIMNTATTEIPAYGYFALESSVPASGYQQISMRVMVGGGAKAYIYLIDTSDPNSEFRNTLSPVMPNVTYWYDDEGNILKGDPTGKKKSEIEIAYYRDENNGLYTKKDEKGTYYANLANYEKDDDNNLVTTDGKIAFYYNKADGEYYAHYDKATNVYSTKVTPLSTDTDLAVRYTAGGVKEQGTCIVVENTEGWVDVSFFVNAGNKAKEFRLEIWAGERDCQIEKVGDDEYKVAENSVGKGIPANGYVFFDNYSTDAAADMNTLLNEYLQELAITLNEKNEASPDDDNYLDWMNLDKLKLPEGVHAEYTAYYYTFTLYDSPDYLRYDKTLNEDWLGYDYTQSEQTERLIWFSYHFEGTILQFLDYSANDVTVPDETLHDNNTSSGNTSSSDKDKDNTAGILTIISSVIFALAILFAIGAVIVRKVWKNKPKKSKTKQPKEAKAPKAPALKVVKSDEAEEAEEPAPEKIEEPEDENNPYNE